MQTAYTMTPARGFPGMIATAESTNVRSFSAEGAIPFGRGVILGTKPNQAKLNATGGTFAGIAVHDYKMADSDGTVQYKTTETVSVLTRGPILVEAIGAVTAGVDAFSIAAAGADQGKFTATASGNIATGGRFRDTLAASGLVEIEINLP